VRISQGHSKNPSCDECDDLSAIFAEVFAGLWHGHAAGADEMEDKVADDCECARSGANAAAILAESHIAHVVKPVLDSPMAA
jgi:hypothetical protein